MSFRSWTDTLLRRNPKPATKLAAPKKNISNEKLAQWHPAYEAHRNFLSHLLGLDQWMVGNYLRGFLTTVLFLSAVALVTVGTLDPLFGEASRVHMRIVNALVFVFCLHDLAFAFDRWPRPWPWPWPWRLLLAVGPLPT